MKPHEFDSHLHSLEREQRLKAEQHDAAAESARDDLADLPGSWPQGWPEAEEHGIKRRIAAAEEGARISRRRADHASAGYLLCTGDEHGDREYMAKYAELISAGHQLGRVRGTA